MTMTNTPTNKSFLIVSSLFGRALCVHNEVATLLRLADCAQISRDRAALSTLIARLRELPLNQRELDCLGYYEAWGDLESPTVIQQLYSLAESAPLGYRARSLMTVGGLLAHSGDYAGGLREHAEALKMIKRLNSRDQQVFSCLLLRNQASILGMSGREGAALEMLQRLRPVVREVSRIFPSFGLEYLNAMANELAEVGRLDEAYRISLIPATSSYSSRFPEWIDTKLTIETRIQTGSTINRFLPRKPTSVKNDRAIEESVKRPALRLVSSNPNPMRPARNNDERLYLVANLINGLIDDGVNQNLLKLMNRLMEDQPTDDFVRRVTKLLDRGRKIGRLS